MTCSTSDCSKEAARGGRCWGCIANYRRSNGVRYTPSPEHAVHGVRYPTPKEHLQEVCRSFAEVDGFDKMAYNRAWKRLEMAIRRYQARGKVKP